MFDLWQLCLKLLAERVWIRSAKGSLRVHVALHRAFRVRLRGVHRRETGKDGIAVPSVERLVRDVEHFPEHRLDLRIAKDGVRRTLDRRLVGVSRRAYVVLEAPPMR